MSTVRPLIVGWKDLLKMGWPYGRAHTWRLMNETIVVTERVRGQKTRVAREIPNPDRFPRCFKLTSHRSGHPVWRVSEVLAYFEAHGLRVTEDWQAP
jgi:predicted DNA-binding transcriptional regulator AlpA